MHDDLNKGKFVVVGEEGQGGWDHDGDGVREFKSAGPDTYNDRMTLISQDEYGVVYIQEFNNANLDPTNKTSKWDTWDPAKDPARNRRQEGNKLVPEELAPGEYDVLVDNHKGNFGLNLFMSSKLSGNLSNLFESYNGYDNPRSGITKELLDQQQARNDFPSVYSSKTTIDLPNIHYGGNSWTFSQACQTIYGYNNGQPRNDYAHFSNMVGWNSNNEWIKGSLGKYYLLNQ